MASKSASSCSFVCARPSWCIALLIDTSDVLSRVRAVQAECVVERFVWREVRGDGDAFALVVEAEVVYGREGEGDSEASCRRLLMLPSPPRPEDVTYVQCTSRRVRVRVRERGREESQSSVILFAEREGIIDRDQG